MLLQIRKKYNQKKPETDSVKQYRQFLPDTIFLQKNNYNFVSFSLYFFYRFTEHRKRRIVLKNCFKLLLYFLTGALALSLVSVFQKIAVGFNPLILKSYIMPVIYGGATGVIIGLDHFNSKKAKNKIQKELNEKEILLKEVQHRIKNNIQSIKAILSMKLTKISSPQAREAISDAIIQVEGMFQIYQKLMLTNNYKMLSSKDYLEDLIKSIRSISTGIDIDLQTEIEDITFNVKQIYSVGCIVNEIITNSIKHAFKGIVSAIIKVKMTRKDNRIILTIQDNGVGLADDFNIEKSAGFGLLLAKLMAQQLDAEFKMENNSGTLTTFSFSIKEALE